ncbi:MAG: threonine/serine exporter family protein [Tissierellia bacterium]|nr:threonine/serine exporter family protein [Tissierellia bacterium]
MEVNIGKLLKVIKLSAQIILENGGETYRAEETIEFIGESFNVKEIESIATPTGFYITISVNGEDNHTLVKRIRKRTIDLQKINDVNNISRQLYLHSITLDQALEELEYINNNTASDKYSLLYVGLSSGFFTLLFGGRILEFFTALFSGILVSIMSRGFVNFHSYQFFSNTVAGAVIAFFAIAVTTLANTGNYNPIIVGGMMPLLPGLAMTNAIRDTMRGDLLSGIARAAEALLVASSLAAGAGVVLYLAYSTGILS